MVYTQTNICAIAVRNGLLEYFVTPSELNCFSQVRNGTYGCVTVCMSCLSHVCVYVRT